MFKKLYLMLFIVFGLSLTLSAQTVVLSDEFDSGDGKWNTGWIEGSTNVTFSIDTNSVLSGKNSYLADIVAASATTYNIQRNADCPLQAGYLYTLSFDAVTDKEGASINVLFEIAGDPYTKRLNVIQEISTTPETYTYTVLSTENVPTNQVKLHYGGSQNDNAKIWVDNVLVTGEPDPGAITHWGDDPMGTGWAVTNDSNTVAGTGGITGSADPWPTNGASLVGSFGQDVEIPADKALVVTGKLTFTGEPSPSYTTLRFAITYRDSLTLQNQYTDSATFVGAVGTSWYGYEFTPRDGTVDQPNGSGGVGSVWGVRKGNWSSTYSNGGGPIGDVVKQAPRNAALSEGTYDWAVSVQQVSDSTNEVRWSFVKSDNKYWFAGSVIAPNWVNDSTYTNAVLNNIGFWTKGETTSTGLGVSGARFEIADPIVIPDAPWEPYYLDAWGDDPMGTGWAVTNDTNTVVGNGGITGSADPWPTNGASLVGSFGQDVKIPTDKALVVKGKLTFTGEPSPSYTTLRFAITYRDSLTLQNQYSDSATFVGGVGTSWYGYEFTPRDGTVDQPNGSGGVGSVWGVRKGNWSSTYSNGGGPIGEVIKQAPRNAALSEGTYDWAVSVQQISDSTNEVRWSLVKSDNKYWFAGSVIAPNWVNDSTYTKAVLNSIGFWTKGETTSTGLDVTDAMIDLTDPIVIPDAPWEPYYLDAWGDDPMGTGWAVTNDTNTVVGNGGITGSADPWPTNGASLVGSFGQDVKIPTDKALVVKGKLTFTGEPSPSYTTLRFAITYRDSLTLQNQYSDSATFVGGVGTSWYGYEFTPRDGTVDQPNGSGGVGSVWGVRKGNWSSTYSNGGGPIGEVIKQAPRNAPLSEGTYNWAVSVQQISDSTNEVRWSLVKSDNKYWFAGSVIAPNWVNDSTYTKAVLNSIGFWTKGETTSTGLDVTDAMIDLTDPIVIPDAPWEDYYVDEWAVIDSRGGWDFTPGTVVGNADFGGDAANTSLAAIRGQFGPVSVKEGKAFIVEGSVVFENGGFDAANSFRFGLFNGDAGTIAANAEQDSNMYWSGNSDGHSGYLFLPQSGAADPVGWANGTDLGTWGAISNTFWYNPTSANNHSIGNTVQTPDGAVAGAETYDFAIQVEPQAEGDADVTFTLYNSDKSYNWQAKSTDSNPPTSVFNSIAFALDAGNSTTAMNIRDVQVKLRDEPIIDAIKEDANRLMPTKFAMRNYPNPFNPSTTIEIALPQNSKVSIVVYDLMGREVTQLLKDTDFNSGYHQVTFDASNLASGMYFYRLEAGNNVIVKKLMLLK